jgi:hypothetical protein
LLGESRDIRVVDVKDGTDTFLRILTIVHLAFFIRACVVDTAAGSGSGQAELGQVKAEVPPQQYQQPYPAQQQPYPAQQYAPQQQQPYPPQ